MSRIRWSQFRARPGRCPLCGPSAFVRFDASEWAVRCLRCESTPAVLALVRVLRRERRSRLRRDRFYEMSSSGPLVAWLGEKGGGLTCSEFFDGIEPGAWHNGVQCQDVQALTYKEESFDVCTSTEVLEHVPDDARAFSELRRVLRPGGLLAFTVPLSGESVTVERARLVDGRIEHLCRPEYHDDRLRGRGQVLAFRTYGEDIVERLLRAGFDSAEIVSGPRWFGVARRVIVGRVAAR